MCTWILHFAHVDDCTLCVCMGGRGLKWLSYYLFTTTSAKHRSQDHGSGVVNRVSSQVNDIRPFEIKVHHLYRDTQTEEDAF